MPDFDWLEASALGRTIAGSLTLTAGLSAAHLLGFTLVMGGAVVSNGRLMGAILPGASFAGVLRVGRFVILTGLAVSIATGIALFSARAATIIESTAFLLKMSLLVAAVAVQIEIWRRAFHDAAAEPSTILIGMLGLTLWLALALSACWFILFE